MSTHKNTWKQRERQAAAIFGARRNVLSGSANRDDRDSSDSTHPRLHIETKLRERWSVVQLWWKIHDLAKKSAKTPVVMLAQKNYASFWMMIHTEQIGAVVREWLAAQSDEELCVIERDVRLLREADS